MRSARRAAPASRTATPSRRWTRRRCASANPPPTSCRSDPAHNNERSGLGANSQPSDLAIGLAKRMECGQLAAAFERIRASESGSKLTALHTLRDSRCQNPFRASYLHPFNHGNTPTLPHFPCVRDGFSRHRVPESAPHRRPRTLDRGHAPPQLLGGALDAASVIAIVAKVLAGDGRVTDEHKRLVVGFDRPVPGGGFDGQLAGHPHRCSDVHQRGVHTQEGFTLSEERGGLAEIARSR